jgi:hypothetical protein
MDTLELMEIYTEAGAAVVLVPLPLHHLRQVGMVEEGKGVVQLVWLNQAHQIPEAVVVVVYTRILCQMQEMEVVVLLFSNLPHHLNKMINRTYFPVKFRLLVIKV